MREAKLINDINTDKNWVGLLFEIWYVGMVENEWKRVEILCENDEGKEEGCNRCQHLAKIHSGWLERIFLLRVSRQTDNATVVSTVGCYRHTPISVEIT